MGTNQKRGGKERENSLSVLPEIKKSLCVRSGQPERKSSVQGGGEC